MGTSQKVYYQVTIASNCYRDDDGYQVAHVEYILNYVSFGILYKYGTEAERQALKMLMLNPTEWLGELVGRVRVDISKRNVSLYERTFVTTQLKPDSNTGKVGGYQNRDSSGRICGHFRRNYCGNRSWLHGVLIQMGWGSKPKGVVVIVGTLVICLRIVEDERNVITVDNGDA